MAATLMYIKSKELLPVEKQVVVEGEDDEADPRWELIRQLVEYKKFKDAAAKLQYREEAQESIFARQPGKPEFTVDEPPQKLVVSVFDLIGAVNNILKRYAAKEGESRDIFQDKWTVSEKIETILTTIESKGAVKFSELFDNAVSRTEVVVTFLAMLELIRLKRVLITQAEPFADIEITRNDLNENTPTNLVTNIEGAHKNNEAEAEAKAAEITSEVAPEAVTAEAEVKPDEAAEPATEAAASEEKP